MTKGLFLGCAAVFVFASACGSDDDSSGSGGAASGGSAGSATGGSGGGSGGGTGGSSGSATGGSAGSATGGSAGTATDGGAGTASGGTAGGGPDASTGGAGGAKPDAGPGSECKKPDDCRLFSSMCSTAPCKCLPLTKQEKDPKCNGVPVTCVVDPCAGKTATCENGFCGVQ